MTSTANEDKNPLTRSERGIALTKRYMLWTAGGGLIPIPLLDVATIMGIQIKMISDLSDIYEIPFSENRVKNIIYPLVTSLGIAPLGAGLVSSLFKVIPVVGYAVGAMSLPLMASALTYATGRVFVSHFESGGTLLDFDPEKMREYYKKEFVAGQKIAGNLDSGSPDSASSGPEAPAKSSAPAGKKAATKTVKK